VAVAEAVAAEAEAVPLQQVFAFVRFLAIFAARLLI
jgi:hypothetical protein